MLLVFRSLIPGIGAADFLLQLLGGEMRFIKGFSGGIRLARAGRLRCSSSYCPPRNRA